MNPITDIEKIVSPPSVGSITGIKPIKIPNVIADARSETDAANRTLQRRFLGISFTFARLGFGEYFWSCMLIATANFPLLPLLKRAIRFMDEAQRSVFGGLFYVSSTFFSGVMAVAIVIAFDIGALLVVLLLVSWSSARREAKEIFANPILRAQIKLASDIVSFNALLDEPVDDHVSHPEKAESLIREKQAELLQRLQNPVLVPPPPMVP